MKERTISGVIIIALLTLVLYFGGLVFDIAIGILSVAAFYELITAKKDLNIPNIMKIIGMICMLMLMYINVDGHTFVFGLSFETLSLVFLLLLAPTIFFKKRNYKVNDAFYMAAVSIFLGTIFNLFIALYNESILQFILIIIIACTTDVFAFLAGKLIGKHKFTKISPNKTIEGCVVGSIVSTIVASTFYITLISSENVYKVIVMIFILTVIGQIGDLFFSLIKRENEIKDFSNLIPGHGGILDRIDSIIFILIAFVFMIQFL